MDHVLILGFKFNVKNVALHIKNINDPQKRPSLHIKSIFTSSKKVIDQIFINSMYLLIAGNK